MKVIALDESGKEVLSTDLPDDQMNRIDAEAARRGISREEMILVAILRGIAMKEQSLPQKGEEPS